MNQTLKINTKVLKLELQCDIEKLSPFSQTIAALVMSCCFPVPESDVTLDDVPIDLNGEKVMPAFKELLDYKGELLESERLLLEVLRSVAEGMADAEEDVSGTSQAAVAPHERREVKRAKPPERAENVRRVSAEKVMPVVPRSVVPGAAVHRARIRRAARGIR